MFIIMLAQVSLGIFGDVLKYYTCICIFAKKVIPMLSYLLSWSIDQAPYIYINNPTSTSDSSLLIRLYRITMQTNECLCVDGMTPLNQSEFSLSTVAWISLREHPFNLKGRGLWLFWGNKFCRQIWLKKNFCLWNVQKKIFC